MGRHDRFWLYGVLAVYAAALAVFSQTRAFSWDETYHLLAAQLIAHGRQPYLDFCFPQSPLGAYWDAAWMRLLGESWRVSHAFAAAWTIGAVVLTADYAYRRFPVPAWRLGAGIAAGLAVGLNPMVFQYGPIGLGYGMCMMLLVAAFRICARSTDRGGLMWPALCGLCASGAAGATLLAAGAMPVLLGWMLFHDRANWWRKLLAFGAGAAIPFAPVFWLFWQAPRQTWFNLVQYHLFYRRLYWPDPGPHDLDVVTSWVDSGPALVTGGLAILGIVFAARKLDWPRALRAELQLCIWLAAVLSIEAIAAHPTFPRYYSLAVPFFAIPAAAGLYALAGARRWAVLLVAALLALGLGRSLYDRREENDWRAYERVAAKVNQVTPPGAWILAEEPIYFLTRRPPPPGLELYYSHKIHLPAADLARYHIVTDEELEQQRKAGLFATAYSCDDDDVKTMKDDFRKSVEMEDCTILWDVKK